MYGWLFIYGQLDHLWWKFDNEIKIIKLVKILIIKNSNKYINLDINFNLFIYIKNN